MAHTTSHTSANLRQRSIRFFVACMTWCLLCWGLLAHAQNGGFLPPEQAFAFKADMSSRNSMQLRFTIAPNYYMYRDEFSVKIVSPDGSVKQVGALKLPKARLEFDENFNKEMAIYENAVLLDVPIENRSAQAALFKVVVTSRGCAKGGLCYPPRQTQAVLSAAALPIAVVTQTKPENNVQAAAKATPDKAATAPAKASPESASSTTQLPSVAVQPEVAAPKQDTAPVTTATPQISPSTSDNSAYSQNVLQNQNFVVALALIFGLGLLLAFTPCMLPMYPILTSILTGQNDTRRVRGAALALAYVTGMALVYAVIGILAAQTGAGLYRYMQSPWILALFAGLLVLLALSMFGLFNIQLPSAWQVWIQQKTQGKNGLAGALLLGAASALIASPCVSAPLIGLIGYVAQTGDMLKGGLALFALAYGMGLPLILMGAGLGRWLPKSGAWMVRIKQLFGVLMLLAAIWVAQPLWYKTWSEWRGQKPVAAFVAVRTLSELNTHINASDKPVFVDVYADWCRSCIEMEREVFPVPEVKNAMNQMTLLRVDMTAYTDDDAEILAALKLYGPPAMLVFEPVHGQEVMRVVGFEKAARFLEQLDQAMARAKQ